MRIPDDIKQVILEYGRQNIAAIIGEYLQLAPGSQGNLSACCPFHKEKTPSFTVSPSRGTWRCFGSCSEGGDAANFIMKLEGINFNEALIKMATRAGISIPGAGETEEEKERKAIFSALAKSEKFYQENLTANTNGGKAYVDSRMTPEMVKSFGIGFAPKNGGKALYDHLFKSGVSEEIAEKAGLIRKGKESEYYDVFRNGRVIFPIKNQTGYTIGFAGRSISSDEQYKYINSPETPVYLKKTALFGLDKCDLSSKTVFVVEGYLDFMQMWSAGIKNVVASCGTSFTRDHILALKKLGVTHLNLMFDGDTAGIRAAQKAVSLAYKEEMSVDVYSLPEGEDPDSYFKKGGNLSNVQFVSGLDFLEKSGVVLNGTMRSLRRLERTEKALLYFAQTIPEVAAILKQRGRLEELFSSDVLAEVQAAL